MDLSRKILPPACLGGLAQSLQDALVRKIFQVNDILIVKAHLLQSQKEGIDRVAGADAIFPGMFRPLIQMKICCLHDLVRSHAGEGLHEMTTVTTAHVAPFIARAFGQPLGGGA